MQNEALSEARLELERTAARLAALYDFAPICYVSLDERGTIRSINHAGEQLLGKVGKVGRPLTGGRFGFFVAEADRAAFNGFIASAFAGDSDRTSVCELTLDLEERGTVPVRLRARLAPSPHEREILLAIEDVSERARSEELAGLYAQLVEKDRRKDEFLGMLSHELRNPLSPLRNSSYVLHHAAPGSEQARRAQQVIERQTAHLTRLVDDLLDVTRIARGKIGLRRDRVDLREVVSRAAEDFRLLLEDRGVTLRTAFPEGKLWADADATRVTQVVGNLLHNAAKFTRRGDEVTLSLRRAGDEAELHLRDTGAGIEPELLPHVFEAFTQGNKTLDRSDGGLGLGLALVKGIVELHGGSVRAASAGTGNGAEFIIRLPLASAAPGAQPSRPALSPADRRRVLVVDDNRDTAESLADLLALLGHEVEVAHDGPTAIEMARASAPDLVLCDIGLPGMSGHEVARALREAGTTAQLFALSGYAQAEDATRAIEAGFDGHFTKPVDPEQIARLLS